MPTTNQGLEILCGLALDGAHLTEVDDLAVGRVLVGHSALGPSALLRDLELRLGLATFELPRALRVARWSARLAQLTLRGRFYSASYAVDAWGTAAELLRWRDLLIEAGWNGGDIAGGGERLQQLAELEALGAPPPGNGERLRAIAAAIASGGSPGYGRLQSIEPLSLWPLSWQRVFDALAMSRCHVEQHHIAHPRADAASDLGRMQRHLADGGEPLRPVGDGTLLFLRGETVWETAHAAAALLRAWEQGDAVRSVVIRSGDRLPFDLALERLGLPTQGTTVSSRLRPLLQVLPLALDLAFEPKDPHRVIELLTLSEGPFRGAMGHYLAGAMSDKPGIGSDLWEAAKVRASETIRSSLAHLPDAEARATIERVLRRVVEWIEAPGHPSRGAARAAVLTVVQRVRTWLQGRMMRAQQEAVAETDQGVELLRVAYAQAAALADAIAADPRPTLSSMQVRQLVEAVGSDIGGFVLRDAQAGRIDHVDQAAALVCPRANVLWWGCTADAAEIRKPVPFARAECDALAAAGVRLVDARAAIAETAAAWRRVVLAATRRCVLVAPRFACGEAVAVHPIWDELAARMGGERRELARVTIDARDVLRGTSFVLDTRARTERLSEHPLPASLVEWRVPPSVFAVATQESATSLETLIGCPLRWVLQHRARLWSRSAIALPEEHILYGKLGHRLIELLHASGAFVSGAEELRRRALETLDEILPREAATLLLPGRHGELEQVREQLVGAVVRLASMLASSQLTIAAVETTETVEWHGRPLVGRLDLLLHDRDRRDVILDLKWGHSTYVDKLAKGAAIQLAIYAFLRKTSAAASAFPRAGYFSLSRGIPIATDDATLAGAFVVPGDDLPSTWTRAEASALLIHRHLASGCIPVAGVALAASVVQACGAQTTQDHLSLKPDAACGYCEFDPICGRRWEAQR